MLMASVTLTGFELQKSVLAVEGLSAPEKSVLLVLAVMANDNAQAWPPINGPIGLAAKTSLSERSVQRSIQTLRDKGHIDRDEKLGVGVVYTIHPRHSVTPDTETPRQTVTPATQAPTPATVAPKQPVTTNTSEAKASSVGVKRASRLSKGWEPVRPYPPNVAELVGLWPPDREQRELDGFRDYWTSRKRDASKLDWDKTWHNRIRDQHDRVLRENRNGPRPSNDRPTEHSNPMVRAGIAKEARYAGF